MDAGFGSGILPPTSRRENVQIRDPASVSRGACPERFVTAVVGRGRRIRSSRFRHSSARRSSRGVSDVVATILLLALTVTLFASVFFFINTFPHPPPQPANQFSAALQYSGTTIVGVSVLHLAGPTIAGISTTQTAIYLQSAAHPGAFGAPFSLAAGLNGSSVWALGQTWKLNLTAYLLIGADNITISIITQSQLLFRITLPGANPNTPPIFSQAGISPATPGPSQPITVFVGVTDNNLNPNSVFVNISEIPGVAGSGLFQMGLLPSSGLWIYTIAAGSTSVGTFYVFVNATDLSGLQNSIAIPVTISNTGGGGSSILQVQVGANNTAPVAGLPVQLQAEVTNTGGSAVTVVIQFYVGAATVGAPSSQGIPAGGTALYTQPWTPAAVGTTSVQALATTTGASAESGFSITVFPKILFIEHAYPAASFPASNSSANIAEMLTADGIPFSTLYVACGSALPATATLKLYGVVIIDFGSATGLVCAQVPPGAAEQLKITGAEATTNFWVIGSNAFTATACTSYSAAFEAQFGLATSGTCTTAKVAGTTLTYTPSITSPALRSDGVTLVAGALTLNQTYQASAAFHPYYTLALTGAGKTWLKDAGGLTIGAYTNTSSNHQQMVLATDPTLIDTTTPNNNAWGTGTGADAAVLYNGVNFLCGLSTTTNSGRGLLDFGIAGAVMIELKHNVPTQFYVAVRSNGPSGGAVFGTLYVNGAPAYYLGSLVTGAVTIGGSGAWSWIAFNWTAPNIGPFQLSIGISSENADLYLPNDLVPMSFYNIPTPFT